MINKSRRLYGENIINKNEHAKNLRYIIEKLDRVIITEEDYKDISLQIDTYSCVNDVVMCIDKMLRQVN